jgi:hypothetical protein
VGLTLLLHSAGDVLAALLEVFFMCAAVHVALRRAGSVVTCVHRIKSSMLIMPSLTA